MAKQADRDLSPPDEQQRPTTRRGALKIYLGAAPGCGKTFAMLREGHHRCHQGQDVVAGYVETYNRPRTIEALGDLEVVPRRAVTHKGATLEDMDLEAVLGRRPHVALVDELAHTNAPRLWHEKRWQDVEVLRDAGIDVITTMNVQHIESVKDLVEGITGITVRETVPDHVVESAEEIRFIDIAPEALRRRMVHGNIYPSERIDAALRNFFRPGNLAALREIALRLVAAAVRRRGGVVELPEDVLVAVSCRETSEPLIRRGARLARRFGGLCTVITIVPPGMEPPQGIARVRKLTDQLGCAFAVLADSDVAGGIIRAARDGGFRHVIVGETQTMPRLGRWRRTVVDRIIDDLRDTDIHVVARVPGWKAERRAAPREGTRPDPDALLRRVEAAGRRRGRLRVYLGCVRGCGTTTAMLDEGRRRAARGTDVVVAAASTHGSERLEPMLDGLELVGGQWGSAARGVVDVRAVLARNPQVACIDDLAAMDSTGRPVLDAVPNLLGAGISLIATLHTLELRSVAASFQPLVGEPYENVIDDSALRLVDDMELVDLTPAELLERLDRGLIMSPAAAARARQGEFRPAVLTALRDMTFRVIAEHTDRQLLDYMRERGIETPWEACSRVVVCVAPSPGMERLIERGARLAAALDGQLAVACVRTHPRSEEEKRWLGAYAALAHQLHGELVSLDGPAVAPALADYARLCRATQLLLGRGRRWRLWRRPLASELIRLLSDVDILVIRDGQVHEVESRPSPQPLAIESAPRPDEAAQDVAASESALSGPSGGA